jgi:uncharacterized protein (TIGR02246 family)
MKRKLQFILFVGITAFIFSACSTASKDEAKPLDLEKAKTEIQAMEDAFAAGEKAKDADAVVAYYSDDAISYSRNKPPTVGKAAIRDSIAAGIARDTTGNHSVYKVVDLIGEGNTLVEVGSWTVMSPAGAEADKGHYMSVFQKKDGKWVCVRDMSATSMPVKK